MRWLQVFCWGILLALPAMAQREQFRNADVMYDWVVNRSGQKLRTFVTRPKRLRARFR